MTEEAPVNKLAYLNRTIKVALTHDAASPPTMGRFGNFFPKTDLGRQDKASQKGNCVATTIFGSACSDVLVPVVVSHNDGDGGLVTP
jgi:hypothetical protein